ncbi:heme binding [Homalodisca vitripennis]|nr:heme binding [Homalodisca vitripennis]
MWDWILLTVVGLVTIVYWYLRRHHNHWESVGVYTPPGVLPGAGHLKEAALFKKSAGWILCEMYHQNKSHPAVGVYIFRKPALMIQDLDLIKDVLIREFSSFHDNSFHLDEKLNPYVKKNLFMEKGQSWKTSRQLVAPVFSNARIKTTFPLIQRVCKEFNEYMEKHLDEDINIHKAISMFTSEIIAKCVFGLDGNVFYDPNAEFYQQGQKLWAGSFYNPVIMFVAFFLPFVNKLLGRGLFPNDVLDFFANTIKQTAEYRKKNPDKVPDDFIQYFLNMKNENAGFTIEDVIAHSLTFFTDGSETSSVVANFLIYELTVNPDIQEAVREEVLAMESFSFESISSLSLLDRVIQETLRKYGLFIMSKECTKDCVLKAGGRSFPVRKGQEVIIPVYGIQRDPDIYPDPDKFDPDRFLPENIKNRHPMTYLSFGGGPRLCIGK